MKKVPFGIFVALFLTACNQEKIHTKQDFLDNQNIYSEFLDKCTNNPGEFGSSQNCTNFNAARKEKEASDFENLL
jgi:hypothetical protein